MLRNSKGQAFSTFQLLIAAVVAMAILMVLLPILTNLGGFITTDPTDEAVENIKDLVSKKGQWKVAGPVTFTQDGSLNAKVIAEKSGGLSSNQVCVLGGAYSDDSSFDSRTSPGKLVKYTGTGTKETKLGILCDRVSDIGEDLSIYNVQDKVPFSECSTGSQCTNQDETCCVVVLLRT